MYVFGLQPLCKQKKQKSNVGIIKGLLEAVYITDPTYKKEENGNNRKSELNSVNVLISNNNSKKMNGKSGQHDDKLKVKEGQVDVLYTKQRLKKKPRKLNDKM